MKLYILLCLFTDIFSGAVSENYFIRHNRNSGVFYQFDNSSNVSLQINRLIQTDMYLNQPHSVYLSTGNQNVFKKRINFQIGSSSLFKCHSDTLKWSPPSTIPTYAEVSLHYCNDYYYKNHISYNNPCPTDSQYSPLFTARRDLGSLDVSVQNFSNTVWVVEKFKFKHDTQPPPSENIEFWISVVPVTRLLTGYFFCRVTIKSQSDSRDIRTFDSAYVDIKSYARSSTPVLFLEGINEGFYALEGQQVWIDCRANLGFPGGRLEVTYRRFWRAGPYLSELTWETLPIESIERVYEYGDEQRVVRCRWQALQFMPNVEQIIRCLVIPPVSFEQDYFAGSPSDERRLDVAYSTSEISIEIQPTFNSGAFPNGTYYIFQGSQVVCNANGVPSPVVRWEALDQPQRTLRCGLSILNNRSLQATCLDDLTSPQVQNFRCRATQESRGSRIPIELMRGFQFIVMKDPSIPNRSPDPEFGDWHCENRPGAAGCSSRSSLSPLVIVLIVAAPILVCIVFTALAAFVVVFRCRRRLFGGRHPPVEPPPVAFSSVGGRRSAHAPQYRESDPPREPLVVTGELFNSGSELLFPQSSPPNHDSSETLLNPPAYDSVTKADGPTASPGAPTI